MTDQTDQTVLTYEGGTEHKLIEIGARVRATYFDGTPVEGTVQSRDWWLDNKIMFYTVRADRNGRDWRDVPEWNIYPGRDAIEAVAAL
jgi:hypothetical protein